MSQTTTTSTTTTTLDWLMKISTTTTFGSGQSLELTMGETIDLADLVIVCIGYNV